MKKLVPLALLCITSLLSNLAQGAPGDSKIARWKDNKTAAFLLMFDDSCPSHYQIAIPELLKRKMIATFYVNPGKWWNPKSTAPNEWETNLPKTGMVYGDHTMYHKGVKDMETADYEIGECQKRIYNIFYKDGKPHFISWGRPGVGPGNWNITKEELKTILDKYHLVDRAEKDLFKHAAFVGLKTPEDMLALADKAIAEKGVDYLLFHGIQRRAEEGDPATNWQDFWALDKDVFRATLDGIAERMNRGDLWVTDHISEYKYQMERDSNPQFKVVKSTPQVLQIQLTSSLDPELYDMPLTITTEVPANWTTVSITQGDQQQTVPVVKGVVQYNALPNGKPISIAAAIPR